MEFKSEAMKQVMRMVERMSVSKAPVLITGEPGTGKDLIAKELHRLSPREAKPFITLNCAALRETLLESELFGHEEGAFPGAYSRKIGLVETANSGTLYLTEIDELSPGLQARLLRFLQEGEIYRVGGKDPIKVDVRLVTATSGELEKKILNGTFREDLYYQINTFIINVPSLRNHKEDLPLLVDHFLTRSQNVLGRVLNLSEEAMEALLQYSWPGNIQELQNEIERASIWAGALDRSGIVSLLDLSEKIRNPGPEITAHDFDPTVTLYEVEKLHILNALNFFKGNKTQAANALGITIKTLYNKLHEYGEL